MNMFNLKGKKAIVTGASGGIGYALVKGMVEAGIEVAMLDYSESLEQIRDELSALGKVYAFRCDLTDRKNRELIFDQAVEALGGTLDILVNSAGVQKTAKRRKCHHELHQITILPYRKKGASPLPFYFIS